MKIRDFVVLFLAILVASGWVVFSGKDGFTTDTGMIVARSMSLVSTIDGRVERAVSEVGAKVGAKDLLALIRNDRIDYGRSAELQSHQTYLQSEIQNAQNVRTELLELHKKFDKRRTSFLKWILKDLRLQQSVMTHQVESAIERNTLKSLEVDRTRTLVKNADISDVVLNNVKAEAAITRNDVAEAKAILARAELLTQTVIANDLIVFENGDTSYWDKTIDAINFRLFNNATQMATLRAELEQSYVQLDVETSRISTDFVEEHLAPFDGVVSAIFVSNGARVNSGTPLFELLDCSRPIAIVPIPEYRFGEFSVGQRVTVQPIDSDQTIKGTIQFMSSGPLIGRDKTITVQQDMTLTGSRAIIAFDKGDESRASLESCDSARKAVVTIHTKSLFDKMSGWFDGIAPETALNGDNDLTISAPK